MCHMVQNNPEIDWNWFFISWNSNIFMLVRDNVVQNNPDINWDCKGVAINPHVTWYKIILI